MPAKIVGAINWMMQPNYPKLSGEEEAETLEVMYFAGNDILPSVLPGYDTKFDDYRWPFFSALDHLTLSNRTVLAMEGGYTYEVTLVYTVPPKMVQVSYVAPPFKAPIEQLKGKYRARWNYAFIVKDGEQFDEDWWFNAKNTELSSEQSAKFKWLKEGDPVPDGWYKLVAATKPGVEVHQTSVPIVTVRRLSLYEDDLEEVANLDNTQQTPPKTYGYTGEWLQSNSSMSKEGRFHILTTVYTGSKEIDDDIYDSPEGG
jgi:hypothetical protein